MTRSVWHADKDAVEFFQDLRIILVWRQGQTLKCVIQVAEMCVLQYMHGGGGESPGRVRNEFIAADNRDKTRVKRLR